MQPLREEPNRKWSGYARKRQPSSFFCRDAACCFYGRSRRGSRHVASYVSTIENRRNTRATLIAAKAIARSGELLLRSYCFEEPVIKIRRPIERLCSNPFVLSVGADVVAIDGFSRHA